MITIERYDSTLVLHSAAGDNRLNATVLEGWEAALDQIEADETIGALISIGDGKFYSYGLDVDILAAADETVGPYLDRVLTLLHRVVVLPVATVAALNGHAFGAGAILALAHDARVMRSDRGLFCLPEVDLGFDFPPLMSALIRSKLSPFAAQEAMTTGHRYRSSEAIERQMVDASASETELLDTALAFAARRGNKHRGALGAIKADLYRSVSSARDGL
jgi:enoyl-CoA hydratase/carnithine racemase